MGLVPSTVRNNHMDKKLKKKKKKNAGLPWQYPFDLQLQTTHENGRGFEESERGLKLFARALL